MLTVRRGPSSWTAACEGAEFERTDLAEAIAEAVGHRRGEALTLGAGAHESIEQWVAEQAARIARDDPFGVRP